MPWAAAQSEFGAAALLKAVWWDLRLASLLTHLFCFFFAFFVFVVFHCIYMRVRVCFLLFFATTG